MLAPLALLLLVGCTDDEEVTWVQFNATDNDLSVEVGVADELDPVSIDLTSSTGQVTVGTATVTPGGGPVGTEHSIEVQVKDAFEDAVGRVLSLIHI